MTEDITTTEELVYGQNPDHVRPDWDEYFMEIMQTVAKRANCDRGRAAAVIVKDRRIVATGAFFGACSTGV